MLENKKYYIYESSRNTQILRINLLESEFKIPANPFVPIILIGPGAGVAPMRALI
jgi:sulfite reductase alpha subunit-like flavoprotein